MAGLYSKVMEMFFGPEEEIAEEDFITPDEDKEVPFVGHSKKSKVVNIHATTQLKVVVIQPESFDEAKEIADHLKSKKPVVINLEKLERDAARRTIDFISGSVYALDGNIQKVANGIFLITPYNVGIMTDIKDEFKNPGFFFQ